MALTTLATLDFEASSLNEHGVPIEVACVLGTPATGIICEFSTLIRPASHWNIRQGWAAESQAIHGITVEELALGLPCENVCAILDQLLHGQMVHVDGGTFDSFWLAKLFGNQTPAFTLDHLRNVDPVDFTAAKRSVPTAHRALPDARWLWHYLAYENM